MKKKVGLFALFALLVSLELQASGTTEDPQERSTKSWKMETIQRLEIRGQVVFQVVPGPQAKVTVETSRALFDQLTVSNWWGTATVAVESGLRGPRERGEVQVVIEVPSLEELTVLDRSSGKVRWPTGKGALLRVGEGSSVDLWFEGPRLSVEASWLSALQLEGKTEFLTAGLRHQARVDARSLSVGSTQLTLDEQSEFQAGPGEQGAGWARHASRISVLKTEGWSRLELKEGSVLETRTE